MEKSAQTSRTVNSLRNMAASLGGQLITNVLRFVCRTVFMYTLGMEYLGISSLYTNILTLLSIAELGFGTAITYSLYSPLAHGDEEKIRSLMDYFRKAYRVIGLVIFGVGLCLLPFLPQLMSGVTDKVNIYLYYLLYLTQTAVSYLFFAYKAVLLNADQKKYLTDLVQYVVQLLVNVVQILVLIFLRSFLVYTVLAIASAIIQNIVTAMVADRRYPYLKKKAAPLGREERRTIFTQVYATALYRISSAVGTATDNLIISSMISVVTVGVYNNYSEIISVFQSVIMGLVRSFSASVGNLFALESRQKSEFTFRCLNLLNNAVVALCAVGFLGVLQPFVQLWTSGHVLPVTVLVIVVYNFAMNFMQLVVNIYNEATGVFVHGKYRAVATAVLNLGISIWLTGRIGLAGVFLGTIVSRLLTTFWYDPWLLYRRAFGMPVRGYFLQYGLTLVLISACAALVHLCGLPLMGHPLLLLLVRGALSLPVTAGAWWLVYHRTPEYAFLRQKVRQVLLRRRGKREK